ncbi:Protein of uncharacterised function (DUF1602) [Vibrio cholerae]|nr:Protein of uncharacterised function (DUF1602) [Vibrio cholerae]
MLCVTITTVYLVLRSWISSSMVKVEIGSSAEVGSSRSNTSGSIAIARAITKRCCCPPDKPNAFSCKRCLTSSHNAAARRDCSAASSNARLFLIPCKRSPYTTFS